MGIFFIYEGAKYTEHSMFQTLLRYYIITDCDTHFEEMIFLVICACLRFQSVILLLWDR
jgi:hypothetical protein